MTLNVQNDAGTVTDANGYLTVAEFKAYHDARGNSYAAAADDTAIEQAIIRATDYVDQRFNFVGRVLNNRTQTTQWPRIDAYDRDRNLVQGIPREVKHAAAEYALRAITASLNPDPDRDTTGATVASKTETVGPITESTTFVEGAVFKMPKYPAADAKLMAAGLLLSGGRVSRG